MVANGALTTLLCVIDAFAGWPLKPFLGRSSAFTSRITLTLLADLMLNPKLTPRCVQMPTSLRWAFAVSLHQQRHAPKNHISFAVVVIRSRLTTELSAVVADITQLMVHWTEVGTE